ncbi:MAG TPA: collagen-like protein [Hyalangium sp.]|nr:collagen-like protein [Hyalangium sp.]
MTAAEIPGINCASGGVRFTAGADADRDGTLDDSEIDAALTRYVCNGAQGLQGATGDTGATGSQGPQGAQGPQGPQGQEGLATLVLTSTEEAGVNCTTGGSKLEMGRDADRNGTLDPNEVDVSLTRYVCNGGQGPQGLQGLQGLQGPQGPSGLATLARTSAESAGVNCATGGTRVELGVDANGNGVLDAGEVNAALTRYVCNGAQGSQGPQGPAGALAAFGDGSAGALSVSVGNTLDLSNPTVVNAQPFRTNNQFSNISIAGTLIVPSGTILRATGDVTVSGTITVLQGAEDTGNGPPAPGVSRGVPGAFHGGTGVSLFAAARMTKSLPMAGGAGEGKIADGPGGSGGGSLVVAAQGNVSIPVGGSITANGTNGVTTAVAGDIGGPGGGAGGIIVVAARGNITVGGTIRANGGNGGNAVNSNGGTTGAGGGGGGGGGIIHLASVNPIAVTGTVQANGGAPGQDQLVTPTGSNITGSGGGACGGDGGDGGGNTAFSGPANPAQAGSVGHVIQLVTAAPENLL